MLSVTVLLKTDFESIAFKMFSSIFLSMGKCFQALCFKAS